ncbi:MAG: hypothetical protein KJ814_07580 [Proteobacteria bacterium]|nr:hypothetical protein [Pseudomonadota bacterium]
MNATENKFMPINYRWLPWLAASSPPGRIVREQMQPGRPRLGEWPVKLQNIRKIITLFRPLISGNLNMERCFLLVADAAGDRKTVVFPCGNLA